MSRVQTFINAIRFWQIQLLYVLAFWLSFPFFRYQVNTDAIAYIGIARKYADVDLLGAINGHWSPLISWILAPLLMLKIAPLFAFKMISFTCGLFALASVYHIGNQLRIQKTAVVITSLLMVPYVMMFALTQNTPDILAFALWLSAFHVLIMLWKNPRFTHKMLLGFMGFLVYVSNYYQFYAFTAAIIIMLVYGWFCKKNLLKQLLVTSFVFFLFSSCWMVCIDGKYGTFSPTTATDFTISRMKLPEIPLPVKAGDSLQDLNYNDYTYTSWEEPVYYEIPYWNPAFSSAAMKQHISERVFPNIIKATLFYFPELLLLIFALVLMIRYKARMHSSYMMILLLALIYPAGHLWMAGEPRHMLFPVFIVLLLSTHFICEYLRANKVTVYIFPLLLALCIAVPAWRIASDPHKGVEAHETAKALNPGKKLKGEHLMSSPGTWEEGLYTAYFSKAVFYDSLKPELVRNNLEELKNRGVQYYFCRTEEAPEGFPLFSADGDFVIVMLY